MCYNIIAIQKCAARHEGDSTWQANRTDIFRIIDGVLKEYSGSEASVVIPEGVKEIGDGAFEGCTSLASVSIPEGVKEIGDGAFEGCTSLTEINYEGTRKEWDSVNKGEDWNKGVPAKEVLFRKK